MSTEQLSPGTVVDGKFTVGTAELARSGAQSYTATDGRGQAVTLTVYDPICFPSGLVMERSLRELRQLQSVSSPRVAAVLACGKLSAGGIYEINAPFPGRRLDEILAEGAVDAADAAALIEQVGTGLLEAQKVGVIHRNLGPRVIFVGEREVVVAGFSVGEPHGQSSRGPLDTIAPEQIEGKVVDQRTLIYNLGALMHMLLTGAPLYSGDPAAQLEQHLLGDLPAEVHSRLQRALGRDPRMRPMMLKQFIAELRAIGGGVARTPVAPSLGGAVAPSVAGGSEGGPSGRGWTMFMKAEEADSPAAASAPKAPEAAEPGKPKTRGWTMFMEAAEEESPPSKPEAPASKPKTRGWTMFMEAEDGGEGQGQGEGEGQGQGEGQGAAASPPTDAAVAPASAPAPATTPAPVVPAADASKPKTRGWTMFMEAEDGGESDAAADAKAEATAESPASAASAAGVPSVGSDAPKSSTTRGWTMFMRAEDGEDNSTPATATPPPEAVAAPPASAPVVPAVDPGGAAPRSRGWTMFTESVGDAPAAAPDGSVPTALADDPEAAPNESAVTVAAEAGDAPDESAVTIAAGAGRAPDESAVTIAAGAGRAPDEAAVTIAAGAGSAPDESAATIVASSTGTDAPAKKRGWTMFMEKPLEQANEEELGGAVPSQGESTAKGWTVFSPAATPEAEAEAEAAEPAAAPASSKTLVATGPPAAAAVMGQTEVPPGSAEAEAVQHRPMTLVATTEPVARPGSRPKTMVTPPGSGPAASVPVAVDTGAVSGPISGPISGPLSGPISGPVSGSQPVLAESRELAPQEKKFPTLLVVVGLALVAAIVVAVVMMSS